MKIPILDEMLMKFTDKSLVDNLVDRCHYVFSTVLLFAFVILVSSKQTFGAPIRCMAPAEYTGQWVSYVDEYCFSTNTYTDMTGGHEIEKGTMNVGYYQWVSVFFLVQAFFFYQPHMLYSHLSSSVSDIDFEATVKHAIEIRQEHDVKKRELKLKKMAAYLCQVNRYREKCGIARGLGSFGCYAYMFVKALNLANVFLQFVALAVFVGQGQLGWGFKLMWDTLHGKQWEHGGYFPRVAYCNISQLSDVNLPKERMVQCALVVNMIIEKLFSIAYFWFLTLFFITLVDLIWSMFYYLSGYGYVNFSKKYLTMMDAVDADELKTELDVQQFIYHTLGIDGLLLFHFIDNHAGGLVAGEIACKYYVKSRNDPHGLLDEVELADDKDEKKKDGDKKE